MNAKVTQIKHEHILSKGNFDILELFRISIKLFLVYAYFGVFTLVYGTMTLLASFPPLNFQLTECLLK